MGTEVTMKDEWREERGSSRGWKASVEMDEEEEDVFWEEVKKVSQASVLNQAKSFTSAALR